MSESPRPDLRFLLSSPEAFVALGFGAGLSPVAPGTAGSLVGIPLGLALDRLPPAWQVGIWTALCLIGLWVCDRAGRSLGVADHPAIVWDEVCAMAVVVLLAPSGIVWIAASFAAFRLFDIVKPWPIDIIDRNLANGIGVMADDLLAAIYALVLLAAADFVLALTGTYWGGLGL